MTSTNKTKHSTGIKGINRMTAKKHKFEGYAVRKRIDGWFFQKYISASAASTACKSIQSQRRVALNYAIASQADLLKIIQNTANWHNDKPTRKAMKRLDDMGFTVKAPAASTEAVVD